MELFRKKIKVVDSCRYSSIGRYFCYLGLALGLIGCGTIKKAGVVATGAAVGATAGTVLSGGAIAPIVGSMGGAFVTDVATAAMGSSRTTMANGSCAPDNFWTLLGSLTEMGG